MIGRLNDSSHALTLGGFGTSPEWGEICSSLKDKKEFSLRLDSSGTGPSDHTSFYLNNIPVLFFFTGEYGDYHKPGDVYDKINYTGELEVVKFVYQVIAAANTRGRFAFTRTRETAAQF
jgi:hypothetical protein